MGTLGLHLILFTCYSKIILFYPYLREEYIFLKKLPAAFLSLMYMFFHLVLPPLLLLLASFFYGKG